MFYWFATSNYTWFVLLSFVNVVLTTRFIAAIKRAAADVLAISSLLGPLHRVLVVYEAQPFESPRLQAISAAVRSNGLAPSRAVAKLERNLEWLESADNWFVKLVNRFVFWTPLSHAHHRNVAATARPPHARVAGQHRRLRSIELARRLRI